MAILTQPYCGLGTNLGYRVGSSGSFTTIGLLADDFEFGPIDNNVIEVKTLASGVLVKLAGRQDPGDITGNIYFVDGDAGFSELWSLSQSKTTVTWQIQLPDGTPPTPPSTVNTGTTYVASAFVSNFAPSGFSGEDSPVAAFTLAVSGYWVRTLGT